NTIEKACNTNEEGDATSSRPPPGNHLRSCARVNRTHLRRRQPLCCLPEAGQRASVRRVAQLLECPPTDLPNPFAGNAHQHADLLERHCLAALLQPVVEGENLSLARREVLLQRHDHEIAHQVEVGGLLGLVAVTVRETFAQCGCVAVAAIDWCVKRYFGCVETSGGPYCGRRLVDELCELLVGGVSFQHLREDGLRARHLDEL